MCIIFQLRTAGKLLKVATMCLIFQLRTVGKYLKVAMICVTVSAQSRWEVAQSS